MVIEIKKLPSGNEGTEIKLSPDDCEEAILEWLKKKNIKPIENLQFLIEDSNKYSDYDPQFSGASFFSDATIKFGD